MYWCLGNFALLDCNWSNKNFNAHGETCRGLDKNGLTHQADMLWLCGLRRMKPKPSQAHSFKYFCLHKCTCHIAQAKSPLQRPDKAGGQNIRKCSMQLVHVSTPLNPPAWQCCGASLARSSTYKQRQGQVQNDKQLHTDHGWLLSEKNPVQTAAAGQVI